ncbi:chemotaxis protein CheC [Methanococcus maripaludis]|uniref:Chemotaxis protein CheC n=3 Tax=Methanococcus maripaludis TaxID=39152 RepID=A0A8T4CKR3_METMI|nr:chemotaxis protein CheC [Methanococcus maripaludis]MBM7408964.1 chemotaxis protein CheC [Methanococcus maripaludis]MBP2218850.1 chemotaxis protein CheC [Methanococcus maripaludis]BAP61148.1 putative chemotaxis protein [Methanococcus maripaludis KA1]CAF30488.1 probable chemotaxis-related protein [Methanococcus maripaludis S2]
MKFSENEWKKLLEIIVDEEAGVETMVVKNNYDLKDVKAFEDIGKAAAEKAANFVQEMSGDCVEVKIFKIELNSAQDLLNMASSPENNVFTKIDFNGDIAGTGVLIFSEESAKSMADSMLLGMGMEGDSNETFCEMRVSAINETCNLLISAFVDTIANFMNTSLNMTPPEFSTGQLSNLVEYELKNHEIGPKDTLFTFNSELFSKGIGSGFNVFIVMDPESTDKLFEKLN